MEENDPTTITCYLTAFHEYLSPKHGRSIFTGSLFNDTKQTLTETAVWFNICTVRSMIYWIMTFFR